MVSGLKRLAADHAALHDDLPPNYLFPSEDSSSDDLTQLTTLLAGPQGTPYSQGLWCVHLKMPDDYPKSPPKATFKTRIWHPNVEELTGAVCVDTLKRDWKATLTLKDVLVTISCLLIYPNPDSALNSAAGALLQENYEAFARQAKLMTSIHAPVPTDLKSAAAEAKTKGEDVGTTIPEQEEPRLLRSRKGTRVQSVTMKKKNTRKNGERASSRSQRQSNSPETENLAEEQQLEIHHEADSILSDDESESLSNASKENDPALSPSPVKFAPPSPRKNALGKRPLSVLTLPLDTDPFAMDPDDSDLEGMTASEKNIAANNYGDSSERDPSPQRKSPKLSVRSKGVNSSGRIREEVKIFEDAPEPLDLDRCHSGDGKENHGSLAGPKGLGLASKKALPTCPPTSLAPPSMSAPSSSKASKAVSGTRKVSGSNLKKAKPRIGIRRL
ncbi:ubiquitin-conjugating enzyme/RWD-like protein [Aspergillus pseudotamarii]|uniref:Ubiquitin-conjugating enzyme/RWD-like protein n=1 Tax=Aspergillus pseudotamarii TaxID=132259 RepID=A0A5N6SL30_ASPPS|nr:ubiquitin-conjugating enzyme/RWD-like protein [Aspergillus pseudotamarii]KAE8134470.1 ubiquitin-conjugating enzyme/RWD-like protein [Aspergillus pseudotamarii]